MNHLNPGHFPPLSPIKDATGFLFIEPAPLLEEERDLSVDAILAYLTHPVFHDRPRPWSRLAAGDNPVYSIQHKRREGGKQRLR